MRSTQLKKFLCLIVILKFTIGGSALYSTPYFFNFPELEENQLIQKSLVLSLATEVKTQSQKESQLVDHVQQSIAKAQQGISKLSPGVLKIVGMSSPKVRHLLNNICSLPETSYLEIGSWKGSTWISALFQNNSSLIQAVGIDNWSKFGGPAAEFQANCEKFLPGFPFTFFAEDSFTLDITKITPHPVTVYFYDGDHSELSQELAFTYYNPVFQDVFIAIVDDWIRPEIRQGTQNAFQKLKYRVLFETVLPNKKINDSENWWNGLYVAVIAKP